MSAAELRGAGGETAGSTADESDDLQRPLTIAPDAVEVRRNAGLAAAVGATASAIAIAYLARAVQTGTVLDWVLVTVMGALGISWLVTFVDARTPLLVADGHGVRMRLGHTWRGLPWTAVQRIEHTPRRGVLRDGRLAVVARNPEKVLAELDPAGLRRARVAERLHGEPFAVPLGLSTRVVGGGDDVQAALERVAARAAEVVVVEPTLTPAAHAEPDAPVVETRVETADEPDRSSTRRVRDPRPLIAVAIARLSAMRPTRAAVGDDGVVDGDSDSVAASATPSPLRDTGAGRRSEVRRDLPADVRPDAEPAGRELRRPGNVSLVEETQVWGERVRPIARQGDAVEPLVLDDFAIEPAEDPVVGPELVAARTRLGLSVDQLAERTRIRPHVIESIEVDDFVPCGGDFYARGHLRTLARILGIDVAPLLTAYDERYAHAPINPRRVFEAELATGASGSIRSTRGGPNWSVLVAVVMALVLCWSVARLVMDTPAELRGATPVLNGSGGPDGAAATTPSEPVEVAVTATAGGAHVVVRDGAGEIVYKGNLAAGDVRELSASPPVRVQSTDGAVTVGLEGADPRPIGEPGVAGQGTFVPR